MAKTLEEINSEFLEQLRSKTQNAGSRAAEDKETKDRETEDNGTKAREPDHKNGLSLVSDIIFYVTIAAMVLCAVLFSRSGVGRNTIGSYQYFEVLTTSMQSVYPRGSLVLVKSIDTDKLQIGDDITFYKDSSTTITHRIIAITENYDGSGNRGFVTKGVENAEPDSGLADERNVVGIVIWHVPYLGALLSWLGENLWLLLVIFGSLLACSFFLRMLCRETSKFFSEKEDKKTENAVADKKTSVFAKIRNSIKQKQDE